ncbi:MAG TPA: shikimate dehydrogenase [Nocardioidaceae bacterium]|nr:shikimate dehydrogenase [Nocardioidaceae bacterium]
MTIEQQRRCAVLGRPIAHSLSPVLHRAGYDAVGLDWSYDAYDVGEHDLAGFVARLGAAWRGLSLTMPLKRTVMPLLDEVTERARQAGAVNTLVIDDGRLVGHNTDIPGAVAAIREQVRGPLHTALVLGGGATATSTLLALADLGCEHVTLVVRDPVRARDALAAAGRHPAAPTVDVRPFGTATGAADIVVSTIPAAAQNADVLAMAGRAPVVFDVVYDPWPTPLAGFALEQGRTLVSGLDLLVHQAGGQFTLMTGLREAPLEVMRVAGARALAERARLTGGSPAPHAGNPPAKGVGD